jgi:hypothetical protein
MPYSTGYFKTETKDYILENYPKDIRILDVGAGCGTYSDLLKPLGYINMDCVEVFPDYITQFNLNQKYTNVFIGDITKLNLDFNDYDLIIFGDVLEHINLSDSKSLLKKIGNKDILIGVPFESPQGEHYGNIYETHLQPELTLISFLTEYEGFHPISVRFDYGIFVNKQVNKVFIEVGQQQLPKNYNDYLKGNYGDVKFIYLNDEDTPTEEPQKVTIVTALWNLGRDSISDSFKRSYDDYLNKFSELLKTDVNMYIFIDKSDEEFIWKYRNKENTVLNYMSLDELKEWFGFTSITNKIRTNEDWLNQASWLRDSPQATLEGYNPLVMSKMFMLNNVTIWNPFNTEYFFWIDAGITNTVHYGYFTHDEVFNNLPEFIDNNEEFVFITYPYEGGGEIHGFQRESIANYSKTDYVKFVCRGGFFGGKKERINQINGLYYSYLDSTLNNNLMGTEESVFTILLHNHPDLITQYMVESNGMIWPFFEDLKNKKYKNNVIVTSPKVKVNDSKVGLYVIGFNSPKQFDTLIQSMLQYDKNFIDKPVKYLLDNSTDLSTTDKYKEICNEYGFEHIKKDNLGICGGRQFIAEHFDESDLEYMFFFEDDMFFYPKKGEICRNGFNRYVEDLYMKSLTIINNEELDFLKLNFSEFYGDNSTQWSWYNVPQVVRESIWPNNKKLPVQGLDPNAPKTKFNNIKSCDGVPYGIGEVYYCNWPQVVSKTGSNKMFLETTWGHPFEQTWMSHMFQETIKGNIKSGVLLLTPTEHNRFDFYESSLRKES